MNNPSPLNRTISLSLRIKYYLRVSVQVTREWGLREFIRRVKGKLAGIVLARLRNKPLSPYVAGQYRGLSPMESGGRKNILVVDARMLTPDRDSGSFRMWNILKTLKDSGYNVTFAASNLEFREPYVSALRKLDIQVITHREISSIEAYVQNAGRHFHGIILSRVIVASRLIDLVRMCAPNALVAFDTVDLHFLREQRHAELNPSPILFEQVEARKKEEISCATKADVTFVVSPAEREVLKQFVPDRTVEVLSNIHVSKKIERPFEERSGILFLGGFEHAPNVDAVHFYAKEIYPLLQDEMNGVKTFIVGSDPPSSVAALADGNIVVTGYVEDLSPFFARCRVFVAPIRYGAGVKGKVNMSMSYGLPVVGTSIALEGTYTRDGVDAMVADEPEVFAQRVIEVYKNKELWKKLSANGVENVERHFSPRVARQVLERIFR